MSNIDRPKVNIRNGFSDRNKIKPINQQIQYKSLDYRTRVLILDLVKSINKSFLSNQNDGYKLLWVRIVLREIYSTPHQWTRHAFRQVEQLNDIIETTILEDDYDDVLSLIEGLCRIWNTYFEKNIDLILTHFNDIFKREFVGYRFVNGLIVEITDENEIKAVEEVISKSDDIISNHFVKALALLSDRENPDYSNSIKESISAVEAICSIITGEQDSLGKLLNLLEKKNFYIHASLKEAFKKLYGYTCDANGIRHAGQIDGHEATFEEAKFMLVACSAFVNYLREIQNSI